MDTIPINSIVIYTKTNSLAKVIAYDHATDSYIIECCQNDEVDSNTINTIRQYINTNIDSNKNKLYDDFIDQQKTFNWWAFFVNNKSSHGPKFEDLPVVPNAQTCIALINIYNYKPIGSKAFSTFLQSWLFSNNASQDDWNTILPSLIQVNWLFYFYKYGFMEVIPNRFVFTKDPRCLPLLRQFVESAHVFNKIRSAYHFNFAGDV